MDQTQWKALNQMLTKQTSGQKSSSAAGSHSQHKSGLSANQQQQYVIVAGGSSQAATSGTGRTGTAGQRSARQSVNGATRTQGSASGETEIVKSLLTGRQYGQSILRPDVGRGSRQQGRTASAGQHAAQQAKGSGKQMSLLQTNWQQTQQQAADASSTSAIQIDPSGLQQVAFSSDMIPEGLGPGEVMYMMVGDVAYQIVGSSKAGGDVSALSATSGISLDDLATISAQQESLKPDMSTFHLQAGDASSSPSTIVSQDVLQAGIDGQQFLQTMPDGTIATMTEDGMQIVMMAGDGYEASQSGKEGETASTIKLGGQDFVLQAGQHLPPELQEMVAKGLPIDWSNYEFIIEGENGPETADAFVMGPTGDHSEVLGIQEMAMVSSGEAVSVLGGGAESGAYSVVTSGAEVGVDEAQSSITVQVITACPGEFDDGEFAYIYASGDDGNLQETGAGSATSDDIKPRVIPYSGFLNSFLDFVQGKGGATLSGVASSSAVTGRPSLPKYALDSASKSKDDHLHQKYKGTPMTIIYTDVTDSSGRPVSYVVTGGSADGLERGKLSAPSGKRKRNQMDGDGDDSGKAEKLYRLSDDGFDLEKVGVKRSSNYVDELSASGRAKARSKSRGSSSGRPSVPEANRLGVFAVAESPMLDGPVVHVTQSEPHFYQKGDFVIDRKDAYKLDSYPIWRIENGKLLQKFDPELEDGLFIHKSASVYSSWSGDIKSNFKPIMVEVVSTSSTSMGRKQDVRVRVLDKYRTKAPDESLEQNPLLQLFNIYLHVLLNQVFEPSYISAIQQQNLECYLEPLVQIDQLLVEAEQAVLQEITWKEGFKMELDTWSCYMIVGLRADQLTLCQAADGTAEKSVMTIKLYGHTYDRETLLAAANELSLANAKEFPIGRATVERVGIYHSLHHFKFLLFTKCKEEASFVKSTTGKSVEEVIDDCIQNRIWVHQLLLDLKGLLERYIIIKTEDDAREAESVAAAQ